MLAGLVAITAPCAFVDPLGGGVIGAIAGVLVVSASSSGTARGVDDPGRRDLGARRQRPLGRDLASASSPTASTAPAGTASCARCVRQSYGSDGVRGLLYGDFSQFIMQLINAAVVLMFGFVMAYVWFKVSDLITPIRVSKEVEIEGLDVAEVGVPGYNDMPEAEKHLGYGTATMQKSA